MGAPTRVTFGGLIHFTERDRTMCLEPIPATAHATTAAETHAYSVPHCTTCGQAYARAEAGEQRWAYPYDGGAAQEAVWWMYSQIMPKDFSPAC